MFCLIEAFVLNRVMNSMEKPTIIGIILVVTASIERPRPIIMPKAANGRSFISLLLMFRFLNNCRIDMKMDEGSNRPTIAE